jgi:Cadherin-like
MAVLSSPFFTSGLFAIVLVTCQYGGLVTSLPAAGPATVAGRDAILHYSINEELAVGSIVANLQQKLSDDVNMTSLTYEVFLGDYSDYFYVDSPSGILRIARVVDRDKICHKKPDCVFHQDVAIVRPFQHFRVSFFISIVNFK